MGNVFSVPAELNGIKNCVKFYSKKLIFLQDKMPLQAEMLAELKPSIHRIIKQLLGFSEETILSESLNSIQRGVDKFELTRRLDKTIMDSKKASRLSDKIYNAVDEFLLARDLPQLNESVKSRKRPPMGSDASDGVTPEKKVKTGNESEGNGN